MKKRLLCVMIAVLILSTITGNFRVCASTLTEGENQKADMQEEENNLPLYAQAATLMDAASGRILFAKRGEEERPNASTTKIMTCILLLEAESDLHRTVTVSPYAAKQPKVHLGMRVGENYLMKDLIYSMMLESHNDSAVALAEYVGRRLLQAEGKEAESEAAVLRFVDAMNKKAEELGCMHTYFVTPNGLDAVRLVSDQKTKKVVEKKHMTCADDLARIMSYCVTKSPCKDLFLEITQTQEYRFSDLDGKRQFQCTNRNALLNQREDAVTGKTGFTTAAGYCYVGCVESEGRVYSLALLGAGWPGHKNDKWKDCKTLFDYGEETYFLTQMKPYYEEMSKAISVPVERGRGELLFETPVCIAAMNERNLDSMPETILLAENERVSVKMDCLKKANAPICEEQKMGTVTLYVGNKKWNEFPMEAKEEIDEMNPKWFAYQILRTYFTF